MQEERGNPAPAGYIATYIDIGFRGLPKDCSITAESILSLSPMEMLTDEAVDMFMYHAACILRKRTQSEVRLVEVVVFTTWRKWATRKPGQKVDNRPGEASMEPPDLLLTCDMRNAEYILMPWGDNTHYSLAIVCNAGNVTMQTACRLCMLLWLPVVATPATCGLLQCWLYCR